MADIENDILSDDQATLLLRIAGELDEAQKRSLDARLMREPALREHLAALTQIDFQLRGGVAIRPMSSVDSQRALNASLGLVREQTLLLQSKPASHLRPHRRLAGIGGWAWSAAVAACIAVGVIVAITNSDPAPLKSAPLGANDDTPKPSEFAAAFDVVEPARTEELTGDIDTQIDALDMLAVMNEPN